MGDNEIVSEGYTLELDCGELANLGDPHLALAHAGRSGKTLIQMFREQGTDLGVVVEELK